MGAEFLVCLKKYPVFTRNKGLLRSQKIPDCPRQKWSFRFLKFELYGASGHPLGQGDFGGITEEHFICISCGFKFLYSSARKLSTKSWSMKWSDKLQPGLEDPRQVTILLAFVLQNNGRLVVSKTELKVLVVQGNSKLQHFKIFALTIFKGECHQKLRVAATLKPHKLQELLVPYWIPPVSFYLEYKSQIDG